MAGSRASRNQPVPVSDSTGPSEHLIWLRIRPDLRMKSRVPPSIKETFIPNHDAVTIHGYQSRYQSRNSKSVDPRDTEELFAKYPTCESPKIILDQRSGRGSQAAGFARLKGHHVATTENSRQARSATQTDNLAQFCFRRRENPSRI